MNFEKRLEAVQSIPILEVAGRLGLNVVSDTCNRCIHPKNKNSGKSVIEFNIHGNYYKCACVKEKGNVVELVKNALKVDTGEAVEWLYEEFRAKAFKQ